MWRFVSNFTGPLDNNPFPNRNSKGKQTVNWSSFWNSLVGSWLCGMVRAPGRAEGNSVSFSISFSGNEPGQIFQISLANASCYLLLIKRFKYYSFYGNLIILNGFQEEFHLISSVVRLSLRNANFETLIGWKKVDQSDTWRRTQQREHNEYIVHCWFTVSIIRKDVCYRIRYDRFDFANNLIFNNHGFSKQDFWKFGHGARYSWFRRRTVSLDEVTVNNI